MASLMVDGLFFLFPLGLQDGCSVHLWKMQKNVENTALVAKMQFVNWKYTVVGCVHLQSIQHTLNILNLGFISSVEHMFQLKQVGAFVVDNGGLIKRKQNDNNCE